MHASIHIVDAPKIDENEFSEVVEFLDKYTTCALLDATKYPEMSNLVKKWFHQSFHQQFVLMKRLMKP